MYNTKATPAKRLALALVILSAVTISCNNNTQTEEKAAVAVDTPAQMMNDTTPVTDTSKMDTAVTRPVKTPN
jgi:hypothetical protein